MILNRKLSLLAKNRNTIKKNQNMTPQQIAKHRKKNSELPKIPFMALDNISQNDNLRSKKESTRHLNQVVTPLFGLSPKDATAFKFPDASNTPRDRTNSSN